MNQFKKLNNIVGWIVFAIATFTYVSTIEPTASFWDCGEYIADCYKLEVGHPPGAPLFLLIGKFFTLFAGDKTQAAKWVNIMSALCSSFSILFLYWSIVALARKVFAAGKELNLAESIAVIGSGAVGALAYTFSDSFWFSAVEGEVYAMSSFFTAIVFWAILKWEQAEDQEDPRANRWLVLISYLTGLSIGVHLLNLLVIPAIVFVYYFKKYKTTPKGLGLAGLVAIVLLGGIQAGIIPWIVKLSAMFELFFVNQIGMPFNSGTIIYFILLFGGTIYAVYYTQKKNKIAWNTIWLSFTMILIGYSSFFVIVIRSQANPPMDENNPENAINLLSYLNREQYGDWPILYGPYYNAPYEDRDVTGDGRVDCNDYYKDRSPVYAQDKKTGRYEITDSCNNAVPNYSSYFCTIFPRMWSTQGHHEREYISWGNIKGEPVKDGNGELFKDERSGNPIMKPTFAENLRYFFSYQVGFMYLRYFAWNFVGRQNDVQGNGSPLEGGLAAFPSRDKLPPSMANNKGHNNLYGIPLVLGLVGFLYQLKRSPKETGIVALLFFFTGLAIVVYLNQYPRQPRERDYAYAASFYAFAIWIGFAVMALFEYLKKATNEKNAAILGTLLCLSAPCLMASQEWDDHDRSNRYTARDFAKDYLASCAKDAILFTNGDNDTFPLWYVQEVEGYRTDVRVVNLSLLNTDWYINQMKRRVYDSSPVPFKMPEEKYRQGTRDYVPVFDRKLKGYSDLKQVLEFVQSDDPNAKVTLSNCQDFNFFPTTSFSVPVDKEKVKKNGSVPPNTPDSLILSSIDWKVNKSTFFKNDLLVLDLIANNNWERPIYFAVTTGNDAYMSLEPYFQLEGLAYRLVPMKVSEMNPVGGMIDTDVMYKNVMKDFAWGGMEKKGVYLDENILRMTSNLRIQMGTLASALIYKGEKQKAIEVLDRCQQVMPDENVPYDATMFNMINDYYKAGAKDKAATLARKLFSIYYKDLLFYNGMNGSDRQFVENDIQRAKIVLTRILQIAQENQDQNLFNELNKQAGNTDITPQR